MSIAPIYGFVKRTPTHLAGSISRYIKELSTIAERFRKFLGESLFRALERALEEALRNEINRALNTDTDMLSLKLPTLADRFWARLSLPLTDANEVALSNPDEIAYLEELAANLAKIIENTV